MASATPLPLAALLAMPSALRRALLGTLAPSASRWTQSRSFCASPRRPRPAQYPNVAALVIPEFRTSSIAELTPDELFKMSTLASAPDQPLADELTRLFTKNPAAFVYAESDFYKLRKNTRVPEVCVLGRSNVGKSSFVNALANRPTNALAHVSSKAGKTKSINTYGFGPAPTIKELQAQGKLKDEDIPAHTFYFVDMPGYGYASLKEWGKNISLYLTKRSAVKGAIVLIDAEVGPKDSDLHLLQVLSAAHLKTAIVLTKADKVKKGIEGLRETCKKVWDAIHDIETSTTSGNWTWEREMYVTAVGAKDPAVVKSTVTTARLAVARLAGLMKDERPDSEKNRRWSGKMISFDDLQYAPGKSIPSESNMNTTKPAQSVRDAPSPPQSATSSGSSKPRSSFADLDQAATAQHRVRAGKSAAFGHGSWTTTKGNRAFYSTSVDKPTHAELKVILASFIKTLKTHTPRDRLRRHQREREINPPKPFKMSFKEREKIAVKRLQERFPEVTSRARAVLKRRTTTMTETEEDRDREQDYGVPETREARRKALVDAPWPTAAPKTRGRDDDGGQALSVRQFDAAFMASDGRADGMKGANERKGGKK
ncbi:hypothetical protein F5Y14DRAFT_424405 [Nemania sp. NC0429]|nr:hypothetical protein F5Y14DRAFT_424405 [Nemania sp. NC0429]